MNIDTVNVKNSDFLYRQVKDWLVGQIRLGKLKPGSRLPGERVLAEKMKISRATARLALQELEKSGTIERIPSKGAFVSTKNKQRKLRFVLLYPETDISLENLSYSNWLASSEFQRGALSVCGANNATLTFQHVPIDSKPDQFIEDLIKEYDGAFFVGHQLAALKSCFKKNQFPHISLGCRDNNSVDYDRYEICEKLAKYLYKCNCRSVTLLSCFTEEPSFIRKMEAFKSVFRSSELNIINYSNSVEESCYNDLKKILPDDPSLLPDVFFGTERAVSSALLRIAQERGWKVPEDFMLVGFADNTNMPGLTYLKLPHFEIGKAGAEQIINFILKDTPMLERTLIPAELVIEKTTYKK
jgi:DNA-binding LacI/PurR family transcriptional regulator